MKKFFLSLTLIPALWFAFPIFAEDEDLPPPRDQSQWMSLVMIALAFVFIYLMMWRPEQKRRKELEAQRSSLKKGDRVTAVGIVGTVIRIQENTVILKMYDGSKIEVLKGVINEVLPGSEDDVKKAEKEERNLPPNESNSKPN
jgi:preprotein translocase subunit YajC